MTLWIPKLPADSDQPLYLAIAEAIENGIRLGELPPGTRLPSQRRLAEALGVTVGTVTRAYLEAQRRGQLRAGVGSGSYVREASRQDPDAPRDLRTHSPSFPEGLDARELLANALRESLGVDTLPGLLGPEASVERPEHRQAGGNWLRRCGVAAEPARVLLTAGAQHGLYCALSVLARPGEAIACERYTNAGFLLAARQLGLRLLCLDSDREGPLPKALEEAVKAGARALYAMPTLANPTAITWSEARRKTLAGLAEKHRLWLLEDDDYGPLASRRPPPLAHFAPERTLSVASLSKALGYGIRLAYLHAPAPLVPALTAQLRASIWTVSPLLAELASHWQQNGFIDKLVAWRQDEARARLILAGTLLGTDVLPEDPASSHLWLTLPPPWRGDRFAHSLEKQGILVAPGADFAADGSASQHVRLSLGALPDRERLAQSLEIIARLRAQAPAPDVQ